MYDFKEYKRTPRFAKADLYDPDWRKTKKGERKYTTNGDHVYLAWIIGQDDGEKGRRIHHYPPGRRAEEYERGFQLGVLEAGEQSPYFFDKFGGSSR